MLRQGKLEVSGGFLLTAAALYYFDTQGLLLWASLACTLHELGHYVAVKLLGGEIVFFKLTAVGGEMGLDRRRPLSYPRELCAILAGPGANLAAALLCAWVGGGETAWLFAGLNLSLGCFNLMPVYPLDGGRALVLALTALCSAEAAEAAARVCSALFVGALLAVGGVLLFGTGQNFTLLLVAGWLLLSLLRRPGEKVKREYHGRMASRKLRP